MKDEDDSSFFVFSINTQPKCQYVTAYFPHFLKDKESGVSKFRF